MISDTIANSIRSRFATDIATGHSLTTQYDNQNLDIPTPPWCRLSILDGESRQTEMGGTGANSYRTVGVMIAQLFYPLGTGDKAARVMAGYIKAAFRSISITGCTFKTPSIKTVGRNDKNEWQVNVSCPFYSTEIG